MITQNIIGYSLSSLSDKRVSAFDPEKKIDLPESFSPATVEEVDQALQKAFNAWRIFREMSTTRRAAFLVAIADEVEALGDSLVARVMQETAYNEARVLVERRRTVSQLRMFAEYITNHNWNNVTIDLAIPGRMPTPRPELRKMNVAIGPVVVFSASNFPLAYSTMGGDSASALAAGCPVIVKAHESHLGTNALIAEAVLNAARKTEMPDGIFSSLIGDGFETGVQLVQHPLTAAVGFTGSLKGGRALFDLGNQREKPIPVFAEMGSVNPIFILPQKIAFDQASLVKQLVDSMTLTVGQFCTNPGIIVAMEDDLTTWLMDQLALALHAIPAATMLNKNISSNFRKGVVALQSHEEVVWMHGHLQDDEDKASPLLAKVGAEYFLQNRSLHHEVFGPFSLIVTCRDMNQMLSVAHALEGQLTSTIHALLPEETDNAHHLLDVLIEKAGRIIFNGVPTGVEVCEAMTHGGPYPASTDQRFTAVGQHAILRWLRPVTFQNCPHELLPQELKDKK